MSNQNQSSARGSKGRLLLWVVLALTVALLSFVTYTAVRTNPLYSDRDTYGISKYKFIEECRDRLQDPAELQLSAGPGQEIPLLDAVRQSGQVRTGESVVVETQAEPRDIVSGVQAVGGGQLGLIAPVVIAIEGEDRQSRRPLGQATMQCSYDKSKPANERLNVVLGIGG